MLYDFSDVCLYSLQLLVLSDLFVDGTHFEWVLDTLLELHHNHSTEDDLLIQYLLPTLCKALAFLKTVRIECLTYVLFVCHIDFEQTLTA